MIKRYYFISVQWSRENGESTGSTTRIIWRKRWFAEDPGVVLEESLSDMQAEYPQHGNVAYITAFNRV